MMRTELLRRGVLVAFVALVAVVLGACARPSADPGTPGGAIAEIERATEAKDWDAYTHAWDMEAAAALFSQRYEEADEAAGTAKRNGAPLADPSEATRTLPLVTPQIFVERLQSYVGAGKTGAGYGFHRLLQAKNIQSVGVNGDEAQVVVRDFGNTPSTARLKLVRVEDHWIVVEVLNADEICRTGHALN